MTAMTAEKAYSAVRDEAESIRNSEPATLQVVDAGDVIRQGDVMVVRLGKALPKKSREWPGRQVAMGTTQGSRHIVEGLCDLFAPDEDSATEILNKFVPDTKGHRQFFGPVIRASAAWTLTHPEHGHRTLPAGDYLVTHQRAYGEKLRRAQD